MIFSETNDIVVECFKQFFDDAYKTARETYGLDYINKKPELVMLGVVAMAIMRAAEILKH